MKEIAENQAAQTFELARFTPGDFAALAKMYRDFDPKGAALGLPPRNDPIVWLESLTPFPNFVVKDKGRVIGHGVLCIEDGAGETAVFVHQDWRGRGIGKMLLLELIEEGRRLGLRRVWGMAAPDNFVMLRLAETLGFEPGRDLGVFHLDLKKTASEELPKVVPAA